MKLLCAVFILIASYTAYSMPEYSFDSVDVESVDGKIRVNFTLNQEISGSSYTVYISCIDLNATMDDDSDNSGRSSGCTQDIGLLELCCENNEGCGINGGWFTGFVKGNPTAGNIYVCSVAFSEGDSDGVLQDTDPFTASTGIPSRPQVNVAERSNETSLPIGITLDHDGVDSSSADQNLIFRVIIRDEDGEVVRNVTKTNTTSRVAFSFDLENGVYTITATVSNTYGTSTEAEEATVMIDRPATTAPTQTTTDSTTDDENNTVNAGAIAGGVVGGILGVMLLVAVGVVVAVFVVMYYKKHKTGVMKVKVAPVE